MTGYRSRCTINNHYFNLVIDNGSCEKIINKGIVEALKLQAAGHRSSCTLSWIKAQGKESSKGMM